MGEEPDALATVFGGLEFGDEEAERGADVRIGGVDVVEEVGWKGKVSCCAEGMRRGGKEGGLHLYQKSELKVIIRRPQWFLIEYAP